MVIVDHVHEPIRGHANPGVGLEASLRGRSRLLSAPLEPGHLEADNQARARGAGGLEEGASIQIHGAHQTSPLSAVRMACLMR